MSEPTPTPSYREFPVETNFQRMARRPGGLDRSQAVEAAAVQLDSLTPEYQAWLGEETAGLIRTVAALRESSAVFATQLESAERHCRQIREIAGTMNADLVTFVADSLWSVLAAYRQNAEQCAEPIDCHVDALRLVSRAEYHGKVPTDLPSFTDGLRRVAQFASSCPACIVKSQGADQNNSSSGE